MEITNWRRLSFFLCICIFCFAFLCVGSSANAQNWAQNANWNNYYAYQTPTLGSSCFYNNMNSAWPPYLNFGNNTALINLHDDGWTKRPNFGMTVYTATVTGNALSIQGTYFSAHTQSGLDFIKTVPFNNSLSSIYSTQYMQFNQAMSGNLGMGSSFNPYVRQALAFSPVLHGPLPPLD